MEYKTQLPTLKQRLEQMLAFFSRSVEITLELGYLLQVYVVQLHH